MQSYICYISFKYSIAIRHQQSPGTNRCGGLCRGARPPGLFVDRAPARRRGQPGTRSARPATSAALIYFVKQLSSCNLCPI